MAALKTLDSIMDKSIGDAANSAKISQDTRWSQVTSAEMMAMYEQLEIDMNMPAMPMIHRYRKHSRKLDHKMRRLLLKQVVETLMLESKNLVTRGGVVTHKTEIHPYNPGGDWDLELSIDKIIGNLTFKIPTYRDLLRRDLIRSKRSFVILADKSNSLGPVIDYVAMAVGILAEAVKKENYALLFFDDDVRTVKSLRDRAEQSQVLEEILDVDCKGATDLRRAFRAGKDQLDTLFDGSEGICVVISDCIPTHGGNPIEVAAQFSRMEILLVKNKNVAIGTSCVDKLVRLPQVRVREIKDFNDIIDAVQKIVSFSELDLH